MLQGIKVACVRGDRELFKDINFSLETGGLLQVRGPNGSGKTSLLRMMCGLSLPASGEICWDGVSIGTLNEEYFARTTYIGHLGGVKDDLTVTYKGHKGLLTYCLGSISIPANAFLRANPEYDFFIDINKSLM